MFMKATNYHRTYPYQKKMNNSQKACEIFYFAKCANFRKINISEGYFIQ